MIARINTLAFAGIKVIDVEVQVHIATGLPAFTIVGLPDKTIAESKERVRAALSSMGLALPGKRITINLAPADLFKEGSHFDLPIACCLLVAMKILPAEQLEQYMVLGEVGLDGSILPAAGVLPASIGALSKGRGIICPKANGSEAIWSGNDDIIAAGDLISLINHFKGSQFIPLPQKANYQPSEEYLDLADIKGQYLAKRALEIAACGSHNLLMNGSPGVGKSMLAHRLKGILPKMEPSEILECSMIASIAGSITDGKLMHERPFRSPHHSCSMAAMVGGGMGKRVMPGEISLAHNGVLFLDELPEFPRQVLDSLRQPLEAGEVSIARANSHVTFPAKFQLIAAMNPCRCGYFNDTTRNCNRVPKCAAEYQAKISGPLVDRIDLHVELNDLTSEELRVSAPKEKTSLIAERVAEVRYRQYIRYKDLPIRTNAELDGQLLQDFATPDLAGEELLNKAVGHFKISMRGYNRILRVARTIADIEGSDKVNKSHIAEALQYRQLPIKKAMSL